MNFLGIQCGANNCRLNLIMPDDKGRMVQRSSEILFWVVFQIERQVFYIPVSKQDLVSNTLIVPSQFFNSMNDRTRSIAKKMPNGTTIIPYGVIIEK